MSESVSKGQAEPQDKGSSVPESDRAGDETLSHDDLFHVLQNQRRRRVLQYLIDGDEGPFEMRQIAEQVAAWEHDTSCEALASDQRQRVYVALYQSHLPKLADVGLIDYNKSRGIVSKRPTIDQVVEHLPENPNENDSSDEDLASEKEEREAGLEAPSDASLYGRVLFSTLGIVSLLAAWIGVVSALTALAVVVFVALAATVVAVAVRE